MKRAIDKTKPKPGRKPKGHKLNIDAPPSTNGHHKPKGHKPEVPVRILRPVVFLPKELTAIEQMIDRTGGVRYAFSMLHILFGDDDYRIEGSDGRMLAVLRGKNPPASQTRDIERNLVDCPDAVGEVLIPADEFLHCLKTMRGTHVGCRLSSKGLHMADPNTVSLVPAAPPDTRFPDFRGVIPTVAPIFAVKMSTDAMSKLMRMVTTLTDTDERQVQVLFYSNNAPIGIFKETKGGILLDALAMPLMPS